MKKIYYLLAGLLAVTNLFAQQPLENNGQPHPIQQQPNGAHQLNNDSRSILYKEINYLHQHYDKPSSTWLTKDSVTYTYNANAQLTGKLTLLYNSGTWKPGTRESRTYNGSGQQLSFLYENWINHLSNWRNNYRETNTYDGNGNLTHYLHEKWDSITAGWVNYQQYTVTFDVQNRQTGFTRQNWSSGSWVNSDRSINHSFDANNNELEYTTQTWVSGAWKNSSRSTFTYDGQNRITSTTTQEWDDVNNNWKNKNRSENTFDGNSNLTLFLILKWNNTTNVWDTASRQSTTFNGQNEPTLLLFEDWISGVWVNTTKVESTFDGNGNEILQQSFTWNTGNNSWRPVVRYTDTYDGNNNVVEHLFEYYSIANQVFDLMDRYFYTWQSFNVTGVAEMENEIEAALFPNPAAGANCVLSFNSTTNATVVISIYDIQGRLLNEQNTLANVGINGFQLNTSNLVSGEYFVRVLNTTNKQSSVLKLWMK